MSDMVSFNSPATIRVLGDLFNDMSSNFSRLTLADIIAKKYNSKVYVNITDIDTNILVRVDKNTYFNMGDSLCYDINDNFVENDPHFYEWNTYKKNYPGKALFIEDNI